MEKNVKKTLRTAHSDYMLNWKHHRLTRLYFNSKPNFDLMLFGKEAKTKEN